MKVVLLVDVKKLAKKGAVVEVADGYGSFLIQKKMATLATQTALSKVVAIQKQKDTKQDDQARIVLEAYATLQDRTIHIPVRVNAKGDLYGTLHSVDISESLQALFGVRIPPALIVIPEPLKHLGTHEVSLESGKVKKKLAIELVAEKII